MANSYSSINPAAPIADISSALQTKYGAGVTIHYETTAYLIFSCAALSDKVIKIYFNSYLRIYYGNAYTSGSTITNEVAFGGYQSGTLSEVHLVLGDNLLYIAALQTMIQTLVFVVAKLSNNDYICMGFSGSSTYEPNSCCKNTTDGININPTSFDQKFMSGTSKLYKYDIILARSDGTCEVNGDGSVATIPGLYFITHTLSPTILLKGATYLMSPSPMYINSDITILRNSLFAEF